LGFADSSAAAEVVAGWADLATADVIDTVLAELQTAADPDLALAGMDRLVRARPELFAALSVDVDLMNRLVAVLGASAALNQHLGAHPGEVDVLAGSVEPVSYTHLTLPTN
jgi:glutamate-ammonia-ligase adenylyltransferase